MLKSLMFNLSMIFSTPLEAISNWASIYFAVFWTNLNRFDKVNDLIICHQNPFWAHAESHQEPVKELV